MSEYLVKMKNVSKSFPGVIALDGVSFDLKPGEVHALLGENGAGKSTLMKILSGVYQNEQGEIEIGGQKVTHLTPKSAQELGVTIIHQELNMCQHLTVAENIFLAREKVKFGMIDHKALNREAKAVLDKLQLTIDPNIDIGELPVSQQQMVEIARSISINSKVIIMDEPTSALTERETEELFKKIKALRASGHGIVYISHRLEELKHIADRVTIFRDGKYVLTSDFKEITIDQIISAMVGREIKEKFPRVKTERGELLLEVKNLKSGKMVEDVSFKLYAGEILGVAGLMGAGRTETARALTGLEKIEDGEIWLYGNKTNITSPKDSIRKGIVYAPEDRKKDGLCTKLTVKENIGLPNMDMVCKFNIISNRKEHQLTQKTIDRLKIKTPSHNQDVINLSGGNQQKVVVGKWLARQAKIVIFDEPTRGIDVMAKVEIYNLINALKKQGIGIIMISSEMPEVLGMSDRLIVMCEGRVTSELVTNETSQVEVMHYATQYRTKILKDAIED